MPFEFEVWNGDLPLLVVRLSEPLDYESSVRAVWEASTHPALGPGTPMLADVRLATYSPSLHELPGFVQAFRSSGVLEGRRVSVLVRRDLHLGLIRQISLLLSGVGLGMRAFKSESEAFAWLGRPGTDPHDRPRFLLLLKPDSYRTRMFLEAARRLELDLTVGTDGLPAIPPPERDFLLLDPRDPAGAAALASEQANVTPFCGVLAVEDAFVPAAAAIAAALGLPHHSIQAVAVSQDKARTRDRLRARGLPTPNWRVLPVSMDPAKVAPSLEYPCVLKPLQLSGSRGVMRCDRAADFPALFERCARIVISGGGTQMLVEDYLPGREFAVEGLVRKGELHVYVVFEKPESVEGPYFEEGIYVTPPQLEEPDREALVQAVVEGCRALELQHGPIHGELRWHLGRATLLEVAPRSIGGRCAAAVGLESGEDYSEAILLAQWSGERPLPSPSMRPSGVCMISASSAGWLGSVTGLAEAGAVPGISAVDWVASRGDPLVPIPEDSRYLGFLFARGATAEEVVRSLKQARDCIRLEVCAEPPRQGAPGDRPTVQVRELH